MYGGEEKSTDITNHVYITGRFHDKTKGATLEYSHQTNVLYTTSFAIGLQL